jgi:hypothetical protein
MPVPARLPWTVIYLLHEGRAQTVTELARAMGTDSGAPSRLVDGWSTRARSYAGFQ